jgi:hypothetical protein
MADESTPTPDTTAPAGEAATPIDPPSAGLHELSKTDRDAFYATGKVPDASDAASDSSTDPAQGQKAAETAASDRAPASEPGKPAKDKKARNSEENRVNELLEDRKRDRERADREARRADALERELAELRKPKSDARADSSPAADPSAPGWKKYRDMKGAPKIGDFEGPDALEDFIEAKSFFIAQQIAREEATGVVTERESQQQELAVAEREMETVVTQAADRLQAEETAHPELRAKVDPRLRQIVPARMLPEGQAVGPHHYAKDQITFESEHPLQLSAFYSSEEGLAEWQALMRMSPKQIERTILARDLSLRTSPRADGKPAAAAKTFTKAPPPPEHSGKKPAQVGDPAEAAVKKGDFRGFMKAMDEREGVAR